jgi:hypothetical protein
MALDSRGFAVTSQARAVVEIHGWNIKAGNVTENAGWVKNYFF